MKKLTLLLIPLILVGGYYFLNKQGNSIENLPIPSPTPTVGIAINYQATFSIITNGTARIFTDPKYHNQSEDVYLESTNPSTVTVKKKGITWNDLFKTLPMEISKECLTTGTGQIFCTNDTKKLRFFINDEEDPDALDKEIQNGDFLRIVY